MGYYTRHTLEILNSDGTPSYEDVYKFRTEISKESEYGQNGWDGDIFDDEMKWYERQEDMVAFSKKYPELIFLISGVGEEDDDQWKEYYKNGKLQREKAQIYFAPYDEAKLESL